MDLVCLFLLTPQREGLQRQKLKELNQEEMRGTRSKI